MHKLFSVRCARIAAAVLVSAILASQAPASAQVITFDPTNYAKNVLTEVNTGKTLIEALKQTAQQELQTKIAQLQTQVLPADLHNQLVQQIGNLIQYVKVGNEVSYTDEALDGDFQAAYPAYKPGSDIHAYEEVWRQHVQDSVTGLIKHSGLLNKHLSDTSAAGELGQIQNLTRASRSAKTAAQIAQVAHAIALKQVDMQRQALQFQMQQAQTQANFYQAQMNTQAAEGLHSQAMQDWLEKSACQNPDKRGCPARPPAR